MSRGTRWSRSRRLAAVPLVMMLSMGCLNPFSDCYSGRTLSELRREGLLVDEPNPSPELVFVTDLTVSQREWFELGWMPLGYASWIGDRTGSKSQARAQASQIGASVVLVQAPQGVYTHSGNKASTPVPMVKSVFLYRPVQAPTLGVLGDTQAFAGNFGSRDALGLLVDVVIRGSPADLMGMRSGDVLVRVGEYEVKGPDSQLEVLQRLARGWPGRVAVSPSLAAAIEGSQGREVEVVWFSGGERKSAIVRLNAAGPFARAGPYQGPY